MLKSLKTNGILIRTVGELLIPYDTPEQLAKLTDTKDIDTVTVAMSLLKQIGLIKILENGAIYIPQIESMVGQKTVGALKKAQQRQLRSSDKSFIELIDGSTDNKELKEALFAFVEMRKSNKIKFTPYALQLNIKKMKSLAPNNEDSQIKIVKQSIERGWQGLFQLSLEQQQKQTTKFE